MNARTYDEVLYENGQSAVIQGEFRVPERVLLVSAIARSLWIMKLLEAPHSTV